MRLLILGGTLFVSHATAAEAVARGHQVTCAARGESGRVPEGSTFVRLDRTSPDWSELADGDWDAVIDVARYPSWVRDAVDALADHVSAWVFVSTVSVYADHATPGQRADRAAMLAAAADDADESDPSQYGELKVSCEQVVLERFGESALVARPGLIVGPGDPSGRFAYWPDRLARGDDVLAPGSPGDAVQMIDVRDVATWLVDAVERRTTGTYDLVGPPMGRADMLAAVARGVGTDPRLTWVDQEFLLEHDVQMWMGDRSLPLWVPVPEHAGLMSRDASPVLATGLVVRPLEETARDTLAWLARDPDAKVTGLTPTEQQELLDTWRRVDLKLS
ncbi:MAG: NAD-dependent epimerase/dehydratase family protein [Nocardioidaceae bacterium]